MQTVEIKYYKCIHKIELLKFEFNAIKKFDESELKSANASVGAHVLFPEDEDITSSLYITEGELMIVFQIETNTETNKITYGHIIQRYFLNIQEFLELYDIPISSDGSVSIESDEDRKKQHLLLQYVRGLLTSQLHQSLNFMLNTFASTSEDYVRFYLPLSAVAPVHPGESSSNNP